MINELDRWVASTHVSLMIRTVDWVIPTVQTIHILAICAVFSALLLIHLRTLGIAMRGWPRAKVAGRFFPIMWYGMLVLFASGLVLVVGEPDRELPNIMFQIKMILLVVALLLTLLFQRPLRTDPLYWEQTVTRRARAVMLSAASLAVWVGIVFLGRWIAYAVNGVG